MISEVLKNEAIQIWCDYGKAINEAFGFNGLIEAEPLNRVIELSDEKKVRDFITAIQESIKIIKESY